jgi:hypothetical protein
MGVKPAAVATLVAAALVSAASTADETISPQTTSTTTFYVSIPLGAVGAKERAPSYGLALQGRRPYETLIIDSRMFSFAEGMLAGIEAKWLIAGAVVVGAGAYAVSKNKDRSDSYSGSQNNQQNSNPPPADCPQTDPCKK